MKQEIDGYIAKYGDKNSPPPWQVFTIANDIRDGNLHLIQKVFEGAFEVYEIVVWIRLHANLVKFDIIYSSGSAPHPTTCMSPP